MTPHDHPRTLPTFDTERLTLRPVLPKDAKRIQQLAGDAKIAATTATIPHPYPDGAAEAWIAKSDAEFEKGLTANFAVVPEGASELIGIVGVFGIDQGNRKAELGYWIGVDYWGKGYGTEAAHAVIKYAFATFDLNRITARYVPSNLGSGKILERIGMTREGLLREDGIKMGVVHDIVVMGILKRELRSNLT